MISSQIRFEENKYKVDSFNDITQESIYEEFKNLRDATDYTLTLKETYYDFKFNKIIFDMNYDRFKLIIENTLNPSEELESEIIIHNEYFNRMMIESNFYLIAEQKDSPEIIEESVGISEENLKNLTLDEIIKSIKNIFEF